MAILKALPGSAKINGKPVKGKLIQVKKSVINIGNFLEKRKEQTQKQIEITEKQNQNFKRRKKEEKLETPKNEWKKLIPKKIPGLSFLDSIKKFIGGWIFGFVAIKLIPLLPSLIPVVVNLGKMVNFIINIGGAFLNGFISFINFGVRAQEATFGFLKDFGGEKFAENFAKFGGLLQGVLDGMLILGGLMLTDALSGDSGFGLGDLFGKKGLGKGLGKLFGKKAAAKTAGGALVKTTAGGAVKTAAGVGTGAAAGIVAGVGLLASGLGEGAFQLKKIGQEGEDKIRKSYEEKSWANPLKYLDWGRLQFSRFINYFIGTLGALFDIIGAPFRYLIELIRYPFLDEAGKAKQAENLAKFDARIREQFRENLNAFSFGMLAKDKGAFGSMFGKKGTDAMGYTKDGKTKSQQKTTAIAPTPKTTKTTTPKTTTPKTPKSRKPQGLMRGIAGVADFMTLGMFDFDKRGRGNRAIGGSKDTRKNFRKLASSRKVSGRFDLKTGKAYINDQEVSTDEYNKFVNLSPREQIQQYGSGVPPIISKQPMKFDEELLGVSASYETNGGQKEYTIYAPTTQINMLPGNDSGQLVTSGSTASSGDDPYEILEKG